jgi:glycosyltransferase involved in cell wall biosynthesis
MTMIKPIRRAGLCNPVFGPVLAGLLAAAIAGPSAAQVGPDSAANTASAVNEIGKRLDDDGVPVSSNNATYLGLQSREVVRGAIQPCIGLINMSSSESFGMVLLEAWLAGEPVIANTACSAFHDLAIHEVNSLLVSKETLGEAMDKLATDELLGDKLGIAERAIVNQYSWCGIGHDFITHGKNILERLPR